MPPPLSPHRLTVDDAWGVDQQERDACRALIRGLRNDGVFTPPSLRGSLVRLHRGGALVAVDLSTGLIKWQSPLGSMPLPAGSALPLNTGSPNLGGPITTASGLVFVGATLDRRLHAFDIETGREVWSTKLPAGGKATPMTYEIGGRQFVVIAAGGGGRFGRGDHIVAFALPPR